jgi:hypothetical protein
MIITTKQSVYFVPAAEGAQGSAAIVFRLEGVRKSPRSRMEQEPSQGKKDFEFSVELFHPHSRAQEAFGLYKDRVTRSHNCKQKSLFLVDVWRCLILIRVTKHWRTCQKISKHRVKAVRLSAFRRLRNHVSRRAFKREVSCRKQLEVRGHPVRTHRMRHDSVGSGCGWSLRRCLWFGRRESLPRLGSCILQPIALVVIVLLLPPSLPPPPPDVCYLPGEAMTVCLSSSCRHHRP